MAEYAKPWLSVDEQIDRLAGHGVEVEDRGRGASVLQAVGYYRLTGYLYPFRESEPYFDDDDGRARVRVLSDHRAGTTLRHAEDVTDFDRRLHMLVMDGVERIEVAVRMRIGYVLGRKSPFAHENPAYFTDVFTAACTKQDAEEIAIAFGVPTKKIMTRWLASLNYVRNVAAHHSRLFNRKLQRAPARPKAGQIPALDHLRDEPAAKGVFATYNALAVIAHLLPSIEPDTDWAEQMAALQREFPASHALTTVSMGAPQNWESLYLWRG